MKFIAAKAALVKLLTDNADDRYKVITYDALPTDAKRYQGSNRTVRVFYQGGKFPSGSQSTPAMHDVSMMIECVVSDAVQADLSVLEDLNATDAQRAAALAEATPGAMRVDASMDELLSIVWDVIMAPQNRWFGGQKYVIGSRWVTEMAKDRLVPIGEYCIMTGFLKLTFDLEEIALGESGGQYEYNKTDFTPIDGDEVQKTQQIIT
jgi:hypothetical protein